MGYSVLTYTCKNEFYVNIYQLHLTSSRNSTDNCGDHANISTAFLNNFPMDKLCVKL